MENLGIREREISCLFGLIIIRRTYYRCPKCGTTHFPYDEQLDIGSSMLSKRTAEAVMGLSIFMPFDHVKRWLKKSMGLNISVTCLEETVKRIGTKLYNDMNKKAARPESIKRPKENKNVLYIQADGSMVPIRGEKEREFKEAKLGLVYSSDDIVHKKTKKGDDVFDIRNKRFVASIGEGVDIFKKMMKAIAIEKGYFAAKTVVLLTDGAAWIAKMKNDYLQNATHILDWYHAVDHLWQCAFALFGEDKKIKCEQWVLPLREMLWNGKVNDVISFLEREVENHKKNQTPIFQLRGYYVSNRENMNYDIYRNSGLYIGSGAIESAHKYIVASRLKQTGMRWTIHHANAMIWLRCKYFEDQWDDFWSSIRVRDYFSKTA